MSAYIRSGLATSTEPILTPDDAMHDVKKDDNKAHRCSNRDSKMLIHSSWHIQLDEPLYTYTDAWFKACADHSQDR